MGRKHDPVTNAVTVAGDDDVEVIIVDPNATNEAADEWDALGRLNWANANAHGNDVNQNSDIAASNGASRQQQCDVLFRLLGLAQQATAVSMDILVQDGLPGRIVRRTARTYFQGVASITEIQDQLDALNCSLPVELPTEVGGPQPGLWD